MSTDTSGQAPSPAPVSSPPVFPVAFIFWQLQSAFWSLLAALSAWQRSGAGLVFGSLALCSALMAAALRRKGGAWAGVAPMRLLSLGGLVLQALALALVAQLMSRRVHSLSLPFGWQLPLAQLMPLALCAAGAWAAFGAWGLWRHRQGARLWSRRTVVAGALGVGVGVLLLGPGHEIRHPESGSSWERRPLAEAWAAPWGRQLRLVAEVGEADASGELPVVSCVAATQRAWLLYTHRVALASPTSDEGETPEQRWARCARESEAALQSGEAIETALLAGDASRYLDRFPADHFRDPIGLPLKRLPAALRSQIERWLPAELARVPSAYDLALAVGRVDLVQRHLPAEELVMPYLRHGLFHLGQAALIEPLQTMTPEVLAAQREAFRGSPAHQLMAAGANGAWAAAMLMGSGSQDALSGGFAPHDYFYANRHCDLAYAEYLQRRGLAPNVEHLKHLVSAVGRFQFGDRREFEFADDRLGDMREADLPQCVKLAAWYGAQVRVASQQDFVALYNLHYGVFSARRDLAQATPPGQPRGDASLTWAVLAAALGAQPPSMAHLCAWAEAGVWDLVEPSEAQPESRQFTLAVAKALRGKPWATVPVMQVNRQTGAEEEGACQLLQMLHGGRRDDITQPFNQQLSELGVPCKAVRQQLPGQPVVPVLQCQPG